MCIVIWKGYENYIDDTTLKNCFSMNPDGAGFALYSEKDGFVFRKGLMTLPEFMDTYSPYNGKNPSNLTKGLIHFRIATHGAVTPENTHPFLVVKDDEPTYKVALAHNGIIAELSKVKDISDTSLFVETVLKPIVNADKYGWMNEGFRILAEKYIGWSKIVIMDSEGNYTILNERQGHWVEGVWFSNYTFEGYSSYLCGMGDSYHGYGGWNNWMDAHKVNATTPTNIIGPTGLVKMSDGSYVSQDVADRIQESSNVATNFRRVYDDDNLDEDTSDFQPPNNLNLLTVGQPLSELQETPTPREERKGII